MNWDRMIKVVLFFVLFEIYVILLWEVIDRAYPLPSSSVFVRVRCTYLEQPCQGQAAETPRIIGEQVDGHDADSAEPDEPGAES